MFQKHYLTILWFENLFYSLKLHQNDMLVAPFFQRAAVKNVVPPILIFAAFAGYYCWPNCRTAELPNCRIDGYFLALLQ